MTTIAIADPTSQELRAALSHPDALYEMVGSRIIEVPAMSAYTSTVAERLWMAIRSVVHPAGLGFVKIETMFILDVAKNIRRRPDVAFVSVERWPHDREMPAEGEFVVIPDLVIEVVSPTDLLSEDAAKRRAYLRYGVRQVWTVLPETREITVHHASPKRVEEFEEGDILEGNPMLPGLRVVVADLFRRTPD